MGSNVLKFHESCSFDAPWLIGSTEKNSRFSHLHIPSDHAIFSEVELNEHFTFFSYTIKNGEEVKHKNTHITICKSITL
jgi:hypothetical protein